MIVKNEEHNLADCLDSIVGAVDEINIVDTGSSDKTIEIAKMYTERVFDFEWIDDFSAARNFSFEKATKDFIMWLDADDILSRENFSMLLKLKEELNDGVDYVMMQYRTLNEDGSPSLVFPKVRITRRAMDIKWHGAVHEDLDAKGYGMNVDICIYHKYKDLKSSRVRNMKILKKEIENGRADYRIHYYYGMANYYEGSFHEAEKYLSMVVESGKTESFDPIELYVALHSIYKTWGDLGKARSILEDNERLMKDKSEYYCCVGLFYRDCLGRTETACDLFKTALTCNGTFLRNELQGQQNPDFYYYIPNMLLGKAYVSMQEPEEAVTYFKQALECKRTDEIVDLVEKLEQIVEMKQLVLV